MRRRTFAYGAASAALMVFACVDGASGPGTYRPVNLDVQVTLPVATPLAWSPVGESLYVSIRRAGRVEPIAETTLVVTEALAATLRVPLSYAIERFVASAEVRYDGALLFLAFESAELREGSDTTVSLAGQYVGPGARTATFELLASDSSLAPQDTARLIRLARDSSGLEIPNVPARFVAARVEVVSVDTAGLLTAVGNAADTARVTGYLPTGHSSGMVVQVVDTTTPPPPPPPVPVVTTVSVSPPAATLTAAGQFAAYIATALDQNGSAMSDVAFTWASSNTAVATIDQEGVATAVGAGSTLITATADGVAGSAMLTVTITPPDDPSLTRSWIGGDAAGAGPNDWSNAANWSPAGVPRSFDSVVIAASANDPILTAAVTIARLRIIGGSLTLNGRSLTVTGDLSTENDAGAILMMQAADTVRVLGNAVFAGSETSAFEDGALFVGGTFEQRVVGDGSASFRAGFAHTTVLNGSAQQLILMHTEIQFGRLEISNSGGARVDPAVDLETEIEIERGLRIMTPVVVDVQGVTLDVEDSLVTVAGSRLTGARVRLAGGMAVTGTFDPDLVQFSGEGHGIQALTYGNVIIEDSVHLRGPTTVSGSLVVEHDGHLKMNGQSLSVAALDVGGSADQGLREAYLTMDNAADMLTVAGDAVFDSDTSGTMSAGTLFVAGSLRIQRGRSFNATGSHRIAVTGAAAQQLRIAEGARLGTLDILNAAGPLTIISPSEAAGLVRLNGKLAIRNPIVVESSAAAFDVADSIVTITGSSLTVGGLILRGAIALEGAFTTERMEFAGMNQDVPAHGVYDGEVTVSGAARLVAATTFSDFTFIHGPQAALTLNGQRLSSGSFSAGTLDEPTGALIMTSAADSLVVAGNVVFAATSTAGQLTAGTIVAGGGFFTGDEPGAFQPSGSHKVVLNGAQQQILQVTATATLSGFNHLELANTSGGIWLRTPITAAGTLRTSTVDQVISGTGHHLLTVGGVDVNRLTLDTIPLAIQSGAITRFDSVTFARQHRAGVQLSVSHPGVATPFTFTGLQFLTEPTTGSYVSATDVAAADGNVLTFVLDETMPGDGSAFTATSGGAVVQWTGAADPTWAAVSGGIGYSCGLRPNGWAYCWGRNFDGQLGDGTTTQRNVPAGVQAEATFTALVAGGHHTCALIPSGAAYCWGTNGSGELGDGTQNNATTPRPVAGGLTFTAIAVGEQHTCGLTAAGAAHCWGENGSGQLGDGTNVNRLTPTAVSGGLTFTRIAAKFSHTCGITDSGAAYCWGHNLSGQLGNGATSNTNAPVAVSGGHTFATVSTASSHTCGATTAGVALCWGWNNFGEIGDGTTTQRDTPTAVSGGLTFAAVTAGGNGFSCGVTTTGAAHCWGVNNVGQLGDGSTTQRLTPTAVSGGLTFASVDAGFAHVVAVSTVGSGYAWGVNNEGQLGDGSTTQRNSPALVTPPTP